MSQQRSRRPPLPQDLVANDREVRDFLRSLGRAPAPSAAPKPKTATKKPRRIRNLAEARWLAEVWADEAAARRARMSNGDKP
jgi:hypothetical protein